MYVDKKASELIGKIMVYGVLHEEELEVSTKELMEHIVGLDKKLILKSAKKTLEGIFPDYKEEVEENLLNIKRGFGLE